MHVGKTRLSRRSILTGTAATALTTTWSALAQSDPRLAIARTKPAVSFYTGLPPDELRSELLDTFKRITGLSTNSYWAPSGQVYNRFLTERRTNAFNVDAISIAGDTEVMKELVTLGAIRQYRTPAIAALAPSYPGSNEHWNMVAQYGLAIEYNTSLVSKVDAPKAWVELADPKWRAKVAIIDPVRSSGGFLFIKIMSHDHGWEWIEKLMRNDPFVAASGPLIDQTIASGERAVGVAATINASEIMKAKASVAIAPAELLFLSPASVALAQGSPNPEGAELLMDFLISPEAAALYTKYGYFSTRPDAAGPFGFPPTPQNKVRYTEMPGSMTRQELLERYTAIADAARRR